MGISDNDVQKQLRHMMAFIEQEANEKAEEIDAKAEEEFNIEKGKLVQQQRQKIMEYYEKKEKQVELQRKIQRSNMQNQSRLKCLKSRDDHLNNVLEESRANLSKISADRERYPAILKGLLLQGFFQLLENKIVLRCRKKDEELVSRILPECLEELQRTWGNRSEVKIDNEHYLPPDSAGGVELLARDGKIRVLSTLEARLDLIADKITPQTRTALFANGRWLLSSNRPRRMFSPKSVKTFKTETNSQQMESDCVIIVVIKANQSYSRRTRIKGTTNCVFGCYGTVYAFIRPPVAAVFYPQYFYCHRLSSARKMGEVRFQSEYISSNRGITKVIQIVLGFVVCSVLCSNWYGGYSCFGEGRLGYVSGLNFLCLLINIVLFLLNLFNIRPLKLEQLYNVVAAILFLVAIVLLLWYMIQNSYWDVWMIIAAVCVLVVFLLFQWDFKGNRTMSDGHLPI
uniref:V-type proton ATPase subunit E n=1 Tax=Globodera rostochiensis TaxID=31243 RepID=A0A914I6X8_GLORO